MEVPFLNPILTVAGGRKEISDMYLLYKRFKEPKLNVGTWKVVRI
jgi:hypothetical protein